MAKTEKTDVISEVTEAASEETDVVLEETESAPKKKARGRLGKVLPWIISGAAVVAAAVILVPTLLKEPDAPVPDEQAGVLGGRGIIAVEENMEELREKFDADRRVEVDQYRTIMSISWDFPTWDTPSENAFVENSVANTRTVYFDLFLESTEELIYSSPYIPVGARLDNFALDAEVPVGEHRAIVTYYLVDDDYNKLSTVSVGVDLIIGE